MPSTMRDMQSLCDFDGVRQRLIERQCALCEALRERFTFEVFHHQKVDIFVATHVEECADVRVIQARDRLRLSLEALAAFRIVREVLGQRLDGDCPIQASIDGSINFAHAADGDETLQLVHAQHASGKPARTDGRLGCGNHVRDVGQLPEMGGCLSMVCCCSLKTKQRLHLTAKDVVRPAGTREKRGPLGRVPLECGMKEAFDVKPSFGHLGSVEFPRSPGDREHLDTKNRRGSVLIVAGRSRFKLATHSEARRPDGGRRGRRAGPMKNQARRASCLRTEA